MKKNKKFPNIFNKDNLVSAIVLVAVIFAVILIMRKNTSANADYICSVTVTETSCTNGSWSAWDTVSKTTDPISGDVTTTENRTYTGVKKVKETMQFHSRRTSCPTGFRQDYYGNTLGGTGYYGGNIISENAACQIVETRVTVNTTGSDDIISGEGGTSSGGGTTVSSSETTGDSSITDESADINAIINMVNNAPIEADFLCSINKNTWTDCSDLKVARKTSPIYVKSFVENANAWIWNVQDNNTQPLQEGQSIGIFENPNVETATMNMQYGSGTKFTKDVKLTTQGKNKFGLQASGSVTKTLGITILEINFNEI